MDTMEWPPEPGTAIVVAALEGVFRKLNVLLGPITTSSPVTQSTRSIMQSFKLGSNGAWEQRSTSQTSHANSAPTSSNTQGSEESLSSPENPEDEQRDPDYCWTHNKIERQESEE